MTKQESNKKWWYRLLKVIFILTFIFSFIIPVTVFVENKPTFNPYVSRFSLRCNDGRIRGDFNGSVLNDSLTGFDSYKDDSAENTAKIVCAYKEVGENFTNLINSKSFATPKEINYQIIMTNSEYDSSWPIAAVTTLLAAIIVVVFFSFVRALFFYVSFGSSFWKNLIWKKE